MNFKNKWVIIAIAIVVLAIIIMITRQSGEPTPVPETTTTIGEVLFEDIVPVDGSDVIIEGDVIIE